MRTVIPFLPLPFLPRAPRAALLVAAAAGLIAMAPPVRADNDAPAHETGANGAPLDRTGHTRTGTASFYAKRFAGRKMADGTPMDPHDDNAASKTLPLGTTAKVTNLETGKSAVVTIQDRGPYVKGRIVDLSPSTARKIGIAPADGLAKVKVAPIAVPQADGGVKLGDAAPAKAKQD